jgi:hypothetical protein
MPKATCVAIFTITPELFKQLLEKLLGRDMANIFL